MLFADQIYKVQKGDTLYSISRKFQITVAELRAANNLSEKDVLKADQKITIPTADISKAASLSGQPVPQENTVNVVNYIVQKGDTFYSLAKKNNMTVAELYSLNGLDSNAVLKVGQKIKIKGKSAQPKPDSAKVTDKKQELSPSKPAETVPEVTPDTRQYGVTTNADSSTSWPVKSPKITYTKGKVSGVQLSCSSSESVTAVREGTVMYVGVYRGFGQVLFVQSKTGLIYAYTGLGSVSVKKGDYITFGSSVGTAGEDPIKGTPQITFMVFQNGTAIDPAKAPRG